MRAYLKRMFQLHNPFYSLCSLILFVTSKCDGLCKGCLYTKKLNSKSGDLSLDDIKKVSKSIGNVGHLRISGGEPSLRKDLFEICECFVKNNNTKMISIPTNGLNANKILILAKKLVRLDCIVGMCVSIDGTKEINDNLRGKGSYERAMYSLMRLVKLENSYKNLFVATATRITNQNIEDIPRLMQEFNKLNVRRRSIFPIRGEVYDNEVKHPSAVEYDKLIKQLSSESDFYDNIKYKIINRILNQNTWSFKCLAGKKIGVIDSDGDVRLCELLDPVGNLKEEGFDFYKIWSSEKARLQRKLIRSGKCSKGCTHGCFLWPSFLNNPLNVVNEIFRSRKFFL